jgi:hypothetical protein
MFELPFIVAHMMADFPLQTDKMATEKFENSVVRFDHATVHYIVTFIFGALFTQLSMMLVFHISVWIAIAHFCIDTRRWGEQKEGFESYPIWVDQTLHLTAIMAILALFG